MQQLIQNHFTPDEWLAQIGNQIRTLRLQKNLDQKTLAERAGISVSALRNLEAGYGATLTTLVKALRILERTSWLTTLAPNITVRPLEMLNRKQPRQRAYKPRTRQS